MLAFTTFAFSPALCSFRCRLKTTGSAAAEYLPTANCFSYLVDTACSTYFFRSCHCTKEVNDEVSSIASCLFRLGTDCELVLVPPRDRRLARDPPTPSNDSYIVSNKYAVHQDDGIRSFLHRRDSFGGDDDPEWQTTTSTTTTTETIDLHSTRTKRRKRTNGAAGQ